MEIKKPRKPKPTLVNLKVHKDELKAIMGKAKKYAKGNISFWLRYAGANHIPKRKDLA